MLLILMACAPSVQRAPEKAARVYCERAEACSLLQEGEREDTCEPNTTDAFDDIWTPELCPDGFDRNAWFTCIDTIETWSCDAIDYGWSEISAACGSRTVCK
ncbi:MAG: hypothetical protein GY913_28605 [Proteobacteria bacterium]|nr:hypothetical protein [Pseudomonadota bacterium]MCP4920874.1 hypothetical protein [Pseudomonadota bacterium]